MNRFLKLIAFMILSVVLGGCVSVRSLDDQKLTTQRFRDESARCTNDLAESRERVRELDDRQAALIDSTSRLTAQADVLKAQSAQYLDSLRECEFRIREREDEFRDDLNNIQTLRREVQEAKATLGPVLERAERDRKLSRMAREMVAELGIVLHDRISSGQISVIADGPRVMLSIQNDLLYKPSSSELSASGRALIKKIATSFRMLGFSGLLLQSHADNIPPSGNLKKLYASNWELTAARAASVAHYLVDRCAIDAVLVKATAMSDNFPVSDNTIREGRARNRRLVIIVSPQDPDRADIDPGAEESAAVVNVPVDGGISNQPEVGGIMNVQDAEAGADLGPESDEPAAVVNVPVDGGISNQPEAGGIMNVQDAETGADLGPESDEPAAVVNVPVDGGISNQPEAGGIMNVQDAETGADLRPEVVESESNQ